MPNLRTSAHLAGTLLALVVLWGSIGDHQGRAPTSQLSPSEREMVGWARNRFALVGLELPPVQVAFHDDTKPCDGNNGLYRKSGSGAEVRICIPDVPTAAFDLLRRRTLVHELAHAWEQASLDDTQRRRLLPILDAESWYAPGSDWDRRGAERFAETIVWGLYDQLRRPTLIDVPCAEIHADFAAITGFGALGPLEVVCHLADPAR